MIYTIMEAIDNVVSHRNYMYIINSNFIFKPWFAQVTWQMVSCDIITLGQQ